MGIIEKGSYGAGLEIRGKVGNSRNFGEKIYSQFGYGEEEPIFGPSQYGCAGFGDDRFGNADSRWGVYRIMKEFGKQEQIKGKFLYPANPQTESQQANRQKYADGIIAWQGLTNIQKEVYNERAKYKNFSGYNLFLKEYLLSN